MSLKKIIKPTSYLVTAKRPTKKCKESGGGREIGIWVDFKRSRQNCIWVFLICSWIVRGERQREKTIVEVFFS
jgi:hypothetical protein